MSTTNCRSQFTAYLRQHGIKYAIWPGHVDINDFRFQFLKESDRIVIRCGYDVPYSYSMPYSYPDTIIKKALDFHQCIKKKYPCKVFLLPEKKLSRNKKTVAKKVMLKRIKQEIPGILVCESGI